MCWENGEENGNYDDGLYRDYRVHCWVPFGIMEKKIGNYYNGLHSIGFRV